MKLPLGNLNPGLYPPPPSIPTRTLYLYSDYHTKGCNLERPYKLM